MLYSIYGIDVFSGIYLACMAGAALIVAVGVDSMKRFVSNLVICQISAII